MTGAGSVAGSPAPSRRHRDQPGSPLSLRGARTERGRRLGAGCGATSASSGITGTAPVDVHPAETDGEEE